MVIKYTEVGYPKRRKVWASVSLGPFTIHNGRSCWVFRGPLEFQWNGKRGRYFHIVLLSRCYWAWRHAFRMAYGVEDKWRIIGPIGIDYWFKGFGKDSSWTD